MNANVGRSGSFCFVVQQLARSEMGLSLHYQDRMAEILKEQLSRTGALHVW
jgi:hypothetical protein